jgi:hypothetical protein
MLAEASLIWQKIDELAMSLCIFNICVQILQDRWASDGAACAYLITCFKCWLKTDELALGRHSTPVHKSLLFN